VIVSAVTTVTLGVATVVVVVVVVGAGATGGVGVGAVTAGLGATDAAQGPVHPTTAQVGAGAPYENPRLLTAPMKSSHDTIAGTR
jgi:hypothetical protein